jgi:hypothetical protein
MARSSKFTTLTPADANPQTDAELRAVVSKLVNSNTGANGSGAWDGGIGDPATGWYRQSGETWDAHLEAVISGSVNLTLPFRTVGAVVKVYHVGSTVTQSNYYVTDSSSVSITGSGKTVVELNLVKASKENV